MTKEQFDEYFTFLAKCVDYRWIFYTAYLMCIFTMLFFIHKYKKTNNKKYKILSIIMFIVIIVLTIIWIVFFYLVIEAFRASFVFEAEGL